MKVLWFNIVRSGFISKSPNFIFLSKCYVSLLLEEKVLSEAKQMRCSCRRRRYFNLFFQTRMLRILHLITCYAGASPQGEACLQTLHCASFEANSTFRLLCAKGGGTACRDGGIVLSNSHFFPLCVILSGA